MKQQMPRLIVLVFGAFLLFQFFVPHESSERAYEFLLDWILIIGVFALAVGIWSLFHVHVDKIRTRKVGWKYSYVTLVGFVSMIMFGLTAQNGQEWGWFFPFLVSVILTVLMVVQALSSKGRAPTYLGLAGLFTLVAILIANFDNDWSFYFQTAVPLRAYLFRSTFDNVLVSLHATMFSLLAFFIASAAYRAFRARNVMATLLLLAALIVMSRFNPYLAPVFGEYVAKLSNWLMNVPNMAAQRAIIMGVGLGMVATALKVILGIERNYMGRG
ncbi:MAG: hypothetical protein AB1772_03225 [Candidatus Zixiibacteriota bacterium]